MSFEVSTPPMKMMQNVGDGDSSIGQCQSLEEWVEIVEPKSQTKIYANLISGICAKHPPDGVTIIKSDEFTEHWWELYDKKTGKYYYYNPEKQKTAWTKPTLTDSLNHRVLIIPVSKLQSCKNLSPMRGGKEKCDASTQTIASNLVSTGTQTISEVAFENELNDNLSSLDISSDQNSKSSNSYTHRSIKNELTSPGRNFLKQRQSSDFTGKTRAFPLRDQLRHTNTVDEQDHSCRIVPSGEIKNHITTRGDPNDDLVAQKASFFNSPASFYNRRSLHIQSHLASPNQDQTKKNLCSDKYVGSTSTFRNPPSNKIPTVLEQRLDQCQSKQPQKPLEHQLTTNNLSQYLVREARAMGIALISDDELDDDDCAESDDDCVVDEDEDTELRDDISTNQREEVAADLNASQDLGEDSSWKSLSDHESPNGHSSQGLMNNHDMRAERSPALSDTSSSFNYNDLSLDERGEPIAPRSQQLDHRKLVENFKKSRQTSAFGLKDSIGRSYKQEANNAVQRIKNVADSYFAADREQLTDKHLRHLSTLSTLPRPLRERTSTPRQQQDTPQGIIDADYDVVEENCGYFSDSDRIQQRLQNHQQQYPHLGALAAANKSGESQSTVSPFDRNKSTRGSTFSVESFARENLSRHPKKGSLIFNRKVKWTRMISWTKNSIKQPMISSVCSDLNADSIGSFKLIQQYMGDRKVTMNKRYRQLLAQSGTSYESLTGSTGSGRKSITRNQSMVGNTTTSSNNSSLVNSSGILSLPDRIRDELAYELTVKGCNKNALRDEIYVQLARQLTENPSQDSVGWGLVLMSILLNYFSPSTKFAPFLLSFLETHTHPMARDVCLPRLDKRLRQNWLTYCRKPADGKEISIVRLSITKWPQYCGVFGESLERIMALQACSPYLKTLRLPWILTTLGEKLIETGGAETEGIFRCAADHDLLAQLRLEIDCVDFRKITDAKQVKSLLSNVQDPHVIAGLLKLFFRQLHEPIFPSQLYEACLQSCQDAKLACRLFNEHLPNLNKDVVAYLVRLLQRLSDGESVAQTKMDSSNLSMVWAPNLLRQPENEGLSSLNLAAGDAGKCGSKWSISNVANTDDSSPASSLQTPSQSMIFEQTRQEMQFIRSLIKHLDTSFIKDVI